jgi:outer membrane protein assembly factor BamA
MSVRGQSAILSLNLDTEKARLCTPVRSKDDHASSGPEISIAAMGFSGFLQIPVSEQDQIVDAITQRTYAGSLDEVKEETQERLRREWQNRGYFKVEVSILASVLTINPASERIALTAHVEEGPRYRLREITFKNNKAITNAKALRNLFRINDGDIFSRETIAKGLENLRKAYGQVGYINFVSVPNATINDDDQTISLDVDIDEGKQFFVSSIDIIGADPQVLTDLALTPGQIYNMRIVDLFLRKHLPGADVNDPNIQHRLLDERNATVALTFDFRSCPAEQ